MEEKDSKVRWRATRIINDCYRSVTAPDADVTAPDFIEKLHTAEDYSEFVTNYSPRKIAAALNRLTAFAHQ